MESHAVLLEVVAVQAVVGADAHLAAIFAGNAYGGAVVGTVRAVEGRQPVLGLDVHGTDAHRCGHIDALAVRRERQLRDVVVGQTVGLVVTVGFLVHDVCLDVACRHIVSQQSLSHGA